MFTKCWAKLRPKLKLFKRCDLLSLNCHHLVKPVSPSARRGGVLCRQSNSHSRGRLQTQREHCTNETSAASRFTMELYLDLLSPPCRSVFLFPKVVGIPFEFKHVDLLSGQQHSEEFGKLSLVRKVPVMKDGSFILTESTAILQYLAQKYSSSVADHWYPANLQQRARVDEYLSWQHMNLRAHGTKVFLLKFMYPLVMDSEPPKEKVDAAVEELNQSLKLLEEKFLQSKPFIIGEQISLADLVAIVELMQPTGVGVDVFEGRPKLIAWRERVKQVLGEELFDETHEKIMKASSRKQRTPQMEMMKPRLQKLLG